MDNSFKIPDFSPLKKYVSDFCRTIQPVEEALQYFGELIRPIVEAVNKHRPQIIEIGQSLIEIAQYSKVIKMLGEAQYVCWDNFSLDWVNAIASTNNIDKTLRELTVIKDFSKTEKTIEKTYSNKLISNHLRLYEQSINAFKNGYNDLAIIGFTAIVDGLLSDISKDTTPSMSKRIAKITKKIENEEILNNEEYAMITLSLTLEAALNSFTENSDFSGKEPKKLNRHWIAHGRAYRRKTKLDCVKMINLIYGLLLIENLNSQYNDS